MLGYCLIIKSFTAPLTFQSFLISDIVLYLPEATPVFNFSTCTLSASFLPGRLSHIFSGLFFILAIIIKYLSLIVELIYSKKTYLVESVERI